MEPAPVKAPRPGLVLALMALLCGVWGTTWLVIRVGLRDLPPLTGAGIRFIIAGAVMAALAPTLAKREGGGRAPTAVVVVQGLCQFALNYALVYLSTAVIPSGLVSVLWSAYPLILALIGHFGTRREPLAARQWFGLGMSFLGIVLLFGTDVSGIGSRAVAMGMLLLLAPAAVAASTTLVKVRAAGSSSVLLNRDSMLLGGVVLLAIGVPLERDLPFRVSALAVGTLLYLSLAGTVLTFGVYLWLLRTVPAYRLSITSYVTPLVALFVGSSLGGEHVGATTLTGTALVLGGVALTLFRGGA
jgi:drug/metabolite transporter (DMT)-like permease